MAPRAGSRSRSPQAPRAAHIPGSPHSLRGSSDQSRQSLTESHTLFRGMHSPLWHLNLLGPSHRVTLMQPTSSLMSSQSYSLSHCRLPWTQVPSEHWNSSGRQVVTAGKGRAGGGEEGGRMVKAAVAQQADTGLGAVCAQGLFRPGTPHLASFSRRPAAHPSYLLFKADKRGKRWASFPPLRKNFPNTPVFVF